MSNTIRNKVYKLYKDIKNNNPTNAARYIKSSDKVDGMLIDTNRFTFYCQVNAGIKPTTSERYLREFKLLDKEKNQ